MFRIILLYSLFFSLILIISDASAQQRLPIPQMDVIAPCKLPDIKSPLSEEKPKGTAWLAPRPPAYPYKSEDNRISDWNSQAVCISVALEKYIMAWMDGKVPAEIPTAYIPDGYHNKDFTQFTLVKADQITPQEQWAIRKAHRINQNALMGSFPDPNVTYLLMPAVVAPFGTTIKIAGEFPYARFFDIQVTPSFDPKSYHYDGAIGVGEVPIVDVDIKPLQGHTNPFLVGANRMAKQRSYQVFYKMAMGDPVLLNKAFRPPYFRDPDNKSNLRYGGAILLQGPWGHPESDGHKRGLWDFGQIWIRYYAPDLKAGVYGGVSLPKITYYLPDGRPYFVKVDFSSFVERVNKTVALDKETATPDPLALETEATGWYKQTGIFKAIISGIASATDWGSKHYVRLLDKGVAGRGEELQPPNNYEQSATSATYVDYLVRGAALEEGKIAVLRGKMPSFPHTRRSEAVMRAADMRYWSITGYYVPSGLDALNIFNPENPVGIAVHSVMDDQVVLDANRYYVIAFSRPEDRPVNAKYNNGVTWVDWGHAGKISWTLRWLTVGPEWRGRMTPSPELLGWKGDWASTFFEKSAISENHHNGILQEYLPVLTYVTKAQFEAGNF